MNTFSLFTLSLVVGISLSVDAQQPAPLQDTSLKANRTAFLKSINQLSHTAPIDKLIELKRGSDNSVHFVVTLDEKTRLPLETQKGFTVDAKLSPVTVVTGHRIDRLRKVSFPVADLTQFYFFSLIDTANKKIVYLQIECKSLSSIAKVSFFNEIPNATQLQYFQNINSADLSASAD